MEDQLQHEVHQAHKDLEVKTKKIALPTNIELLGKKVIDAAFHVHSTLGPGLLESVYETCLEIELRKRLIDVERQLTLAINYEGNIIDNALKLDLVVERKIILELKSVEALLPVHEAQILTYLKLSGMRLGFLINFGDPYFRRGIKRFVN